jgi:hypothetical protein
MHEVKINDTVLQIPSSWDELTRKQLELVAGMASNSFGKDDFKRCLLFYAAGIQVQHLVKRSFIDRTENLYQVKLPDGITANVSAAQIAEITDLFNFLFKINEETEAISIDSQLTVNLIHKFKVNRITYYGPTMKLFNITMSEFIHAETNLNRFVKTKEVKYLDNLIAILYRPSKNPLRQISNQYNGDRRISFNDHKFEKRADKIRTLNHTTKIAILYFYQGCQAWYQRKFPHVFKSGGKKAANDLGFLNLVDALTGGDVTKTDNVRKSYLMDVMVHLERAAIEYEEMEAKLKKK